MQTLAKERVTEYLKRDRYITIPQLHAEIFYTPDHIWAQATPQETVKIGVTDYFQTQLKEVINIQTAKTGEKVSKGEPFGVVETWWFTYDLYSPLNGTIISINKTVIDNPFVVNVDPYKWIMEVQPEQKEANSWMKGLLKEEPLGVVETWMFMFDLHSPVSGRIAKINGVLRDEPFIISRDPYKAGWIAEIKPNNSITAEEELRDLMKPHQYEVWSLKLGGRRILGL